MASSIGFRILSFLPSCHSSYGAWTLAPVGLSPTVHASLRWTHTFRDRSIVDQRFGNLALVEIGRLGQISGLPIIPSARSWSFYLGTWPPHARPKTSGHLMTHSEKQDRRSHHFALQILVRLRPDTALSFVHHGFLH